MTWYELWLFLHILAAMVWIGSATAIQVFGILTKRATDPAKSAFFAQSVSFTVNRVLFPTSLVVLVAGIGLVENGNWDWDEPFVLWGLLLWLAVSLVAFGFLGRALGSAAGRLSADGPSPELALRFRNLTWLSRALLVTLVVIVFLMTVKPGT
ncbi:MAG TPA: DUF2269 family protein [Gaiellaceae bacterium]|nr:DUF2269 family protein [Gaiellaceae bacterium]